MTTKVIKVDEKSYQIMSKPRKEYCEEDKRKLSLNAIAKNILYSALDQNEFKHIRTFDFIFDICHAL